MTTALAISALLLLALQIVWLWRIVTEPETVVEGGATHALVNSRLTKALEKLAALGREIR